MVFNSASGKVDPAPTFTEKIVRCEDGTLERIVFIDNEIFRLPLKYCHLRPLGKGSYGSVCAAYDLVLDADVAIKKIRSLSQDDVDAKRALRELRIMRHAGHHNNITQLYDIFYSEEDDALYLIMELMDSTLHAINFSMHLSDEHIILIMSKILCAVMYMHKSSLIHRDLKPANILVSRNCDVRVCDFGLARAFRLPENEDAGLDMTRHVVTRRYRAPELMLSIDKKYDESIDMWSIGCIFAELLSRKPLFPGKTFKHQLSLIFNTIGAPTDEEVSYIRGIEARKFLSKMKGKKRRNFGEMFPSASSDAVDLLEKLLVFDPMKRISAREALNHRYFRSVKESLDVAAAPCSAQWDFETMTLSKSELMNLIKEEIASFKVSRHGKELKGADMSFPSSTTSRPATSTISLTCSDGYFENMTDTECCRNSGSTRMDRRYSRHDWSKRLHKRNRVLLLDLSKLNHRAENWKAENLSKLKPESIRFDDSSSNDVFLMKNIFNSCSDESNLSQEHVAMLRFNMLRKNKSKIVEEEADSADTIDSRPLKVKKISLIRRSQRFWSRMVHRK